MTNLSRLALLTAVTALASCPGEGDGGQTLQERRPNVVFVLLDDARYDDLHRIVTFPKLLHDAGQGSPVRAPGTFSCTVRA